LAIGKPLGAGRSGRSAAGFRAKAAISRTIALPRPADTVGPFGLTKPTPHRTATWFGHLEYRLDQHNPPAFLLQCSNATTRGLFRRKASEEAVLIDSHVAMQKRLSTSSPEGHGRPRG
jgi:hypothetical protein